MPDVWFIRHGECTANIGEATRTAQEAHLTPRGWKQAQQIAHYLHKHLYRRSFKIITSSYLRAQETAEPTRRVFPKAPCDSSEKVREFDYLSLPTDILTTSNDRASLVNMFWQRNNPDFRHESRAESFTIFINRVQDVLSDLREQQEDTPIVVFSHYQFIHAVWWLLNRETQGADEQTSAMSDFYRVLKEVPISNGAILKTYLSRDKQTVLSYETSHLVNDLQPVGATH